MKPSAAFVSSILMAALAQLFLAEEAQDLKLDFAVMGLHAGQDLRSRETQQYQPRWDCD
ncbi:MAG: hypothetical protein ACKOBC_06180 [Hyphomicrobiales bacterium]